MLAIWPEKADPFLLLLQWGPSSVVATHKPKKYEMKNYCGPKKCVDIEKNMCVFMSLSSSNL